MASKNVEKTRLRLEKRIEEGSYYEAHQQLRVVSQRYVKAGDYPSATSILFSGAQSLLKASQTSSGCDLCLLLIDTLKSASLPPSSESRAQLMQLISLIPPTEPSRKRVINDAIAWTSKTGPFPAGDPELHHFLGTLFANEDDPYAAEKHLIVGTAASATTLATLLYSWYKEDEPHTAPLYAARAVFPYLLVGNVRDAGRVLEYFIAALEKEDGVAVQDAGEGVKVFPGMPLVNFLGLLVRAVRVGAADLFRTLRQHYAGSLKEVQAWDEILEQLGEIYFGIQVRRSNNFLDMMGSLLGGGAPQAPAGRQIGAPAGAGEAVELD